MAEFHVFSAGWQDNHCSKAEGIMKMRRVTMQNQMKPRVYEDVRRRRVTPKEILEKVDAKQDIEAPMEVIREMVARFAGSMLMVCLPNPRFSPIWVRIVTMRRNIY